MNRDRAAGRVQIALEFSILLAVSMHYKMFTEKSLSQECMQNRVQGMVVVRKLLPYLRKNIIGQECSKT